MTKSLKEYMMFKLKQHKRLHGLDDSTKEEIAAILEENMKAWVSEAVAAGV